jgi:AP-4 complex subunit epsilon-1
LNVKDKNEYLARLLEILEILSGEDGELYARQVMELFKELDSAQIGKDDALLEDVVEMVLVYVRNGELSFYLASSSGLI